MTANQDYFEIPERLGNLTYRCKYCGQECVEKTGLASGLSPTKKGSYGASCTPTPASYNDLIYTASTISFTAATATEAAKINDSALMLAEKHITPEVVIAVVTGSGTNDGTYTIEVRGVAPGVLSLSSSDDVTTEDAATAGEVSIYRTIYQPNVTGGCGFCGSLNSK
jgi:hypothetical protein